MSYAPHGDATEYGVSYVVLVPGEQPRRVTTWEGVERTFVENLIHELRRNILRPDGVRYVQVRMRTRRNPVMEEVHALRADIWQNTSAFGKAWLSERRLGNPYNIPTECWSPRDAVLHLSQKQRYALTNNLEEWMDYGTDEGDAWVDQHYAQRWQAHLDAAGFTEADHILRSKPMTPAML